MRIVNAEFMRLIEVPVPTLDANTRGLNIEEWILHKELAALRVLNQRSLVGD